MWASRLQRTGGSGDRVRRLAPGGVAHPLDEPEATGRLCRVHADSLRPPCGWRFFDYREPAQPDSEVADLLDARSPLLERAFWGARAS